jgi:hypothetical protein
MLKDIRSLDGEPTKDVTTMVVPIDRNMLIRIKQVSAAKHYKSTAEMVRYVMKQYLKAEGI